MRTLRDWMVTEAGAAVLLVRLLAGGVFLSEGIQKFLYPLDLGTAMAHEARTDWCMLLGSVFLMLAGAGAWSIDAKLVADHRPRNHAGNRV